jgi:CubicO group peptidase (beta-lactamase class C family)
VDPKSPLVDKPMAMDTAMRIELCTKLMTSISVLQCVKRGLLDFDAAVSTILAEWKDAILLKGFEDGTGKPVVKKAKNKMILRSLLT